MTKDKSRTTGSPTFRIEEQKRLSERPKESCSNEDPLSFLKELNSKPKKKKKNSSVSRVVISDITKPKEAEEILWIERNSPEQVVDTRTATLKESEEHYRIAIENSHEGVAIVQNNVHVYVNKAFLNMFGYNTLDEIVERQKYCIVHPDDYEKVIEYASARLEGGYAPARYEFKGVRKDGTPIDVEALVNVIPYKGQKAIITYLSDITVCKATEKALKERLEFESLLANLSGRFINVPLEQVDEEIDESLRMICEQVNLDIATLWQWSNSESNILTLSNLYRPMGGPPPPMQIDAKDIFPWCLRELKAGKIVAVSTEEAPAEAVRDQETWRFYGIKSSLNLPLTVGGRQPIIGLLSFNTVREKHSWPDELVKRLYLVAEIFTNAMARRQSERVLQENEERLSLASASVGMGLWTLDLSTGQFWATTKALELFDLSPNYKLSLDKLLKLIHPEDRDQIIQAIHTASQSNDDFHIQYRTLLADNRIRWIASRGRRQLVSSGKVELVMGVSWDITEPKLAETVAAERQSMITAVLESTDDMIWSVDIKRFGLLTFNTALKEYFHSGMGLTITKGMSPDDMVGEAFTLAVARKWHEFYERALREGPYSEEYSSSTGKQILFLSFNVLKQGEENFGISVFAKNITERKRLTQKIEESAREWQATFDSIPDMVMVLDREQKVVRANAAIKSFFGLPLEEIIGIRYHDLMHGIEKPFEGCLFAKTIQSKKHEEKEVYDEPRQACFRICVDPIFNEEREITWVVHSMKDITEQKRALAKNFAATREMLQAERLMHMGELTASLAHELNQPLMSILSNTRAAQRFMQSGTLDLEELKEILEDIASDDKRAGDIIRSLRSMMKPDESESELIVVNDLLRGAVNLFHSEAIVRNIQIEINFVETLMKVNVDKIQIQQVMINLLLNASESMTESTEHRRIIIRTAISENNKIEVSVRDFGIGIQESKMEKLFEPFFTTKGSGLGIGLSLSRSIIAAHGGHIRVENNPDGGATFYFDLPIAGSR